MRTYRQLQFLIMIGVVLCGISGRVMPVVPEAAAQSRGLPPPHLGYGIHVGPHSGVNPALVDELRMDWVKLYMEGQVASYRDKRVLFRMDLGWTDNWEALRGTIRERAARLASLGVDAVEVHNEPNLSMEWPRGPNAWEYTQLLRVAYTEIKAVAPNLIVVSGGLAPTITTANRQAISDIDFATEMLDNGAAQWFDAFGYHPYGYNQAPEVAPSYDTLTFRRVELIRALFEERGIYDKQIWLTEFGWLRDPSEDGVFCSDSDPDFSGFAWLRVSAETQADYTVRAFDWADRHWPWVGPMFLWNLNWALYEPEVNPLCSHMRWFGVLKSDGTRLPVFQRVAAMPRRYSDYLPKLTIYAEDLSVETSMYCPGSVMVGEFEVVNSGYPGNFSATVDVATPPNGPTVTIYPERLRNGDRVQVFADTTDVPPGLHIIYLNVQTTIGGRAVSEVIQGYVVVTDIAGGC